MYDKRREATKGKKTHILRDEYKLKVDYTVQAKDEYLKAIIVMLNKKNIIKGDDKEEELIAEIQKMDTLKEHQKIFGGLVDEKGIKEKSIIKMDYLDSNDAKIHQAEIDTQKKIFKMAGLENNTPDDTLGVKHLIRQIKEYQKLMREPETILDEFEQNKKNIDDRTKLLFEQEYINHLYYKVDLEAKKFENIGIENIYKNPEGVIRIRTLGTLEEGLKDKSIMIHPRITQQDAEKLAIKKMKLFQENEYVGLRLIYPFINF